MILGVALLAFVGSAVAQNSSTSGVSRRSGNDPRSSKAATSGAGNVTQRMQSHFESVPKSDADMHWMRVIYRQLDLTKDENSPLYFPDEPIDGQESLFRIIMRLLANDQLAAYEYLDGREVFTDQYRLKVKDMLDRFHVLYTPAKGSTAQHPKFDIDESDVPANEVLSYYIVERWEFDTRSNRMHTVIEAICPVLHRAGDFGYEAVKYPMFWVKFDELRPFLSTQNIFTSDDNNLASCTYDDYFQLGLYKGDIYKTRNLRNKSLMQLYPDPEDLARAQDSIQHRLDTFGDKLWVEDPVAVTEAKKKGKNKDVAAEEVAAADDSSEPAADADDSAVKEEKKSVRTKRGSKDKEVKPKKLKAPKASKSSGSSKSGVTRSVRNRRR